MERLVKAILLSTVLTATYIGFNAINFLLFGEVHKDMLGCMFLGVISTNSYLFMEFCYLRWSNYSVSCYVWWDYSVQVNAQVV